MGIYVVTSIVTLVITLVTKSHARGCLESFGIVFEFVLVERDAGEGRVH